MRGNDGPLCLGQTFYLFSLQSQLKSNKWLLASDVFTAQDLAVTRALLTPEIVPSRGPLLVLEEVLLRKLNSSLMVHKSSFNAVGLCIRLLPEVRPFCHAGR